MDIIIVGQMVSSLLFLIVGAILLCSGAIRALRSLSPINAIVPGVAIIASILLISLGLSLVVPLPSEEKNKRVAQKQLYQSDRFNQERIKYFRDERTGICFARYRHTLATVPCDEVEKLIALKPE